MRRVSDHHQAQSATLSTPPTMDCDINLHFPHESDARSVVCSDAFARVQSRFIHFKSVIHDHRARIAAIPAIDKEVTTAMLLLRSLSNAFAPISVLPPEVLARIFHFLSLEEPPCTGQQVEPQDLGWVRATHVCQLWRQVALGDSSLWAQIPYVPGSRDIVSEMLARARNTLLDIEVELTWSSVSCFLSIFSPHISHTRQLHLYGLDSSPLEDILSQEAPALEHLLLQVSDTYSDLSFWEPGGTTLFKGRAPRLRTLYLSDVFIPWSLIPRGQLTELEIYLDKAAHISDAHGDLNQLIDLLANCPALEVLVLESCLPSRLSSRLSCGQTIHLPILSRLRLGGSSSRITNLLKMLKLPTSTALQLYCTSENASTDDDHHLLPVVLAHFQSPAPVEFKQLTLSLTDLELKVTASTSLPKSSCQSQDFESYMEVDFVLSFDGMPREDLIEQVCKMLPISNLESLHICAPDRVSPIAGPMNWAELFKRCPEVTTMRATGRGTSSFVRALSTPRVPKMRRGWTEKNLGHDSRDSTSAQSARGTAPHAHTPIFPKLTFMSLKTLDFGESKSSGILFNVIQNGLRQRKGAYGAPLKTLCIDDCAISTMRAMALQRLVEKLLWDGEEGGGYEYVPQVPGSSTVFPDGTVLYYGEF